MAKLVSGSTAHKKIYRYSLTFFLLMLITIMLIDPIGIVSVNAQGPGTDKYAAGIDQLAQTFMKTHDNVQGLAIGFIALASDAAQPPQVSKFFYGTVEKGKQQLPDGKTLFEIGSETKLFSAIMLAKNVNASIMQLSDPVKNYLPGDVKIPTLSGKPITLVELATHRSGLPRMPSNLNTSKYGAEARANYSEQDLYNFLSHYQLTREPDSAWEYSNLGFGLLGTLLARQAGMSYEEMIMQNITKPLGMPDTVLFPNTEQTKRIALGYSVDAKLAPPAHNNNALAGAGGYYSTIDDYVKFAQASMGATRGQELTDLNKAIALTQIVQGDSDNGKMGLGWQENIYPGLLGLTIWKDGAEAGYQSAIAITSDRKFAVVIFTNTYESVTGLGNKILAFAENKSAKP